MGELYEKESFVYNKVPVRIMNHAYNDIFTPLHWHRNIEINLVTYGEIVYQVDGKQELLRVGDMNIINSGELHSNHLVQVGEHFEAVMVQISKTFLDRWLGSGTILRKPEGDTGLRQFQEIILRLGEIERCQSEMMHFEVMEQIFALLAVMKKHFVQPASAGKRQEEALGKFKDILRYIEEHYTEDLAMASIAESFHYTKEHVSRLFKEHANTTFYHYLQATRLNHAIHLMRTQRDMSLMDCAMQSGFPNVKSFIDAFKREMGTTPLKWKKLHI